MSALMLVLLLSLQIEIGLVENRLVSLLVKVLRHKLLVFDSLLCTVSDGRYILSRVHQVLGK